MSFENQDDENAKETRAPLGFLRHLRFIGRKFIMVTVGSFFLAILVSYTIGTLALEKIDDSLVIDTPEPPPPSFVVAAMADLIEREAVTHTWTPNKPFFWPTAFLDNMPNYQKGIVAGLRRFSMPLANDIGRLRGSSEEDGGLADARSKLNVAAERWIFGSSSLLPIAPAETEYKSALKDLRDYAQRLTAGQAILDRRADNLVATLDEITADLGGASAQIDEYLDAQKKGISVRDETFFNAQNDDLFYQGKGKLYAYAIILRALGKDYDTVLIERNAKGVWDQMIASLEEGAQMRPWIVMGGQPDGLFRPSHLAAQGFFMLKARIQLREVSRVLQAQGR